MNDELPAGDRAEPAVVDPASADSATVDESDSSWRRRCVYLWGLILIAMTAGALVSMWNMDASHRVVSSLQDGDFNSFSVQGAALMLFIVVALGFAFALSMRMGAANPGILLVAVTGTVIPSWAVDGSAGLNFVWALIVASLATVLFTVLTLYLSINSWIAGIASGALTLAITWNVAQHDRSTGSDFGYDIEWSVWVFVAALVVVGLTTSVVASLCRFDRQLDDVADMVVHKRPRDQRLTVLFAVGSLATHFLAAIALVSPMYYVRNPFGIVGNQEDLLPHMWDNVNGFWSYLLLAIAAVLIAGVSTRRRPGGAALIVVSSVLIVCLVISYDAFNWDPTQGHSDELANVFIVPGALLMAGVVVSHVLDRLAKPTDYRVTETPESPEEQNHRSRPSVAADGSLDLGELPPNRNLDLYDPHPNGFKFAQLFARCRVVGDEGVDSVGGADAGERVSADFGSVGNDHDLASPGRHQRVYGGFTFVVRGRSEFHVDGVDPEECDI